MAITVLPKQQNLSELLGTGLGTALGTGLQSLAAQNLQNMLAGKKRSSVTAGLESLGFAPDQAAALSGLDPASLREVIKYQQQAPREQAFAEALSGLLGSGTQQEGPVSVLGEAGKQVSPVTKALPRLSEQQALKLAELQLKKEEMTKKEAQELKKLEREKEKEKKAEQHIINKETQQLYDELNKEYKSALNNDKRLDRIEKLTKEGNLGIPIFNSLLKAVSKGIMGVGLDLTSLMTTDAQELEKLSTDFVREAKGIFGPRLTDADLSAFMRIIPTLAQSNKGRMRVVHNMRLFNAATKVKKKAMDEIIKENGGVRPFNLDQLIEERSKEELDDLSALFEKNRPQDKPTSLAGAVGTLGEGLLYY